ncbi:hypothetical protein CEP52_000811 [Fusarium oligoseptatum]|uniref:Spindle pole body-associated protein cut12 domain-containing protein n=1 Tax=Fusarium oligoseptatum TaxID=2604345 RepID=A0A428ULY4_9HYPO|nr:hypothetical protein CEP52_000811 [Fusarium oligoseptatum]
MLGWMLRRGEDAPNAVHDGDTTQIDVPDTPAPVFAARAFKSALFGTPARPSDNQAARAAKEKNMKTEAVSQTPPRPPQGILLTPGTGTTRRKRVSFGQDVKKTNDLDVIHDNETRHRTRLNEALEKASRSAAQEAATRRKQDDTSDDEWEEADDEDCCTHDITVDLNEPHSQSGKYWKEEFEKYHDEAKIEMEKLLKYKQLAKSYAKQKDAEASDLAVKLKEEQQKVIEMEKQIAEGASQIASKRGDRSDDVNSEFLSTLTKQTALAVQYRTRVQELEDQLEEFLKDREDDLDSKAGRRRRLATSPRTQKTILETQRELRKARAQVKELGELRDQVSTLRAQLRAAEKRASKAETQTTAVPDTPRESARAQDLRVQLREAREENKKKDEEIRKLKEEFEAFRKESEAQATDKNGVLERAHTKIAELKKEIRTLKTGDQERAARPKSWHVHTEISRLVEENSRRKEESSERAFNQRGHDLERRSFDLTDLQGEAIGLKTANPNIPSLRQKFHEDALPKVTQSDVGTTKQSGLGDRPNLGRPRWQPFVPRSPRNRAYLGEELTKRIESGGAASGLPELDDIAVPDLPALAKSIARSKRNTTTDKADDNIDLLQDRFTRLGGPDQNNGAPPATTTTTASKGTLPPERRAAAIARIEQRMAEKKRAQRRKGFDKENVRP